MIDRVTFTNFKLLRQAILPLAPFTILIGANASGKSTALEAMRLAAIGQNLVDPGSCRWAGDAKSVERSIEVAFEFAAPLEGVTCRVVFNPMCVEISRGGKALMPDAPEVSQVKAILSRFSGFKLDAKQIAAPAPLGMRQMQADGTGLASVLFHLSNAEPRRFAAMQAELSEWMAEYDGVGWSERSPGNVAIELRVRHSGRMIPADQLSDGTLYALAILTLSHLADPPAVITIEEPDRGIHPRLLRQLQDALYRLSYPADHGEKRRACQVIATTHSPYFLDLFKDHLQEVVIAHQQEGEDGAAALQTTFMRLSDEPDIGEILQGAPLGEAWFSGLLSQ